MIKEAESVTEQQKRKRKYDNKESVVHNIAVASSSNVVATIDNPPVLDFVEGGFIISFKDSVEQNLVQDLR